MHSVKHLLEYCKYTCLHAQTKLLHRVVMGDTSRYRIDTIPSIWSPGIVNIDTQTVQYWVWVGTTI